MVLEIWNAAGQSFGIPVRRGILAKKHLAHIVVDANYSIEFPRKESDRFASDQSRGTCNYTNFHFVILLSVSIIFIWSLTLTIIQTVFSPAIISSPLILARNPPFFRLNLLKNGFRSNLDI